MLLRNWEIFDPSDTSGKYAADIENYNMVTKAIKNKYGALGKIRLVNMQMAKDLNGRPIPPCTLPLTARDGLTEWAYTENAGNIRRTKEGVVTLNRKSKLLRSGELMLDVNKDIDLLYFLFEKSQEIKKGRIKIDDIREIEAEKAKHERDAIKLKAAIWGEASPLSAEGTLRQVCHALGISNADKGTEDSLRLKLESFINSEDKKKNVRGMTTGNFLDFISMGDEVNRRGLVNKAVTRKIIEYTKMYGWVWKVSNETIVRVPEARFADKFAYLCEFFGNPANTEMFDKLVQEMAENGYFEDEQPYEEVKWLAKRYGIKVAQTGKKDLAKNIVEHFKA